MIAGLVDGMGKTQLAAYLINMAPRLAELYRILKATGSIYLHCDPTASHYLKVIMDAIFGHANFRNEIVWAYRRWPAKQQNFQRMHDVILRYTKGSHATWNQLFEPLTKATLKRFGTKQQVADFSTGKRLPRQTEEESRTAPMRDVWDISIVAPVAKERLGYPTQKPLALLNRIIRASSNPGDVVLDPFCGCGTSISSAERLQRRWMGIDITYAALAAIRERFRREEIPIWGDVEIVNLPDTDEAIANRLLDVAQDPLHPRKEFEKFCVASIGGLPNEKMGADGGVDGRIQLLLNKRANVSVKSGAVTVRDIRDLRGTLNDKKEIGGVFVTRQPPTRPMREFVNTSGVINLELLPPFPKMQILTLDEILKGKRPELPYAYAA